MRSRSMPTPLVELPCGSASMSSVLRSAVASDAARLTAVVVLPTPPFWLAIAITRDIINRCLAKSYIAFKLTRTQYTLVSRETKEHTFHVKLQPWGLGDPPAPACCLEDEVVEVAGRHTRDACRLRQRTGTHAIKLLTCFRRQGPQLEIGQVRRQHKRCELGEARSSLALAREIAVVFDLNLRSQDRLGRRLGPHAGRCEQRRQRDTWPLRDHGDAIALRECRTAFSERTGCLFRSDRRLAREPQRELLGIEPSLGRAQLVAGQQTKPLREGHQTTQRVVLAEEQPKFRPRREQPVRLVDSARHQIIDQHSDVRVVASEDHRLGAADPAHGVDAGHDALARCFLVARRPVDLTGKEEMLDALHLEPGRELSRRIVVVLDRVARPRHPGALETRDGVQELELHGDGQGSRQAVHVQLGGVEPLRLEEDLVARGRRELHDLVLDRGAIAWPATADRATVQRRLFQVALDDVLHVFAGPCDPARHLTRPLDALVEREAEVGAVAVLPLDLAPIHRAAIDTRRSAGLEARYCKSHTLNDLRHLYRWLISRTARRNLRVGADVNATAQESAGSDDDGAGGEVPSVFRLDPADPRAMLIEEQICDHALGELEGRELLEQRAHGALVQRAISLCARGPDCWALGAIQHADRKSTRLNSSHSQISYAVFCLKKKKPTNHAH